jgi:hypothetical protein
VPKQLWNKRETVDGLLVLFTLCWASKAMLLPLVLSLFRGVQPGDRPEATSPAAGERTVVHGLTLYVF